VDALRLRIAIQADPGRPRTSGLRGSQPLHSVHALVGCARRSRAHVWDVMGRGINSVVITDLNDEWGKSTCTLRQVRAGGARRAACSTRARSVDHPKYPDFLPNLKI